MKKLFLFLFAATMLASCSSNEDNLTSDNGSQKTYPVTLNISGFKLESTPLKSLYPGEDTIPSNNYLQYVIYKADGSVLLNKKIVPKDIDGNNIQIKEELPAGNYNIAILSAPYSPPNSPSLQFHHLIPSPNSIT